MNDSNWWDVLVLFLIPIGGGIPGGVLLAKTRGIEWPMMAVLYFVSDVILACAFEPLMKLAIAVGRRIPWVLRVIEHFRRTTQKAAARYGARPHPLKLILVSFIVDPMTGRAAAYAAGHGFVTGWLIAIAGDMIYFSIVMISTLWLSDILGDGTIAMLIILVVMVGAPPLLQKIREAFRKRPQLPPPPVPPKTE